jgi:RNA recognition motif-containing protein
MTVKLSKEENMNKKLYVGGLPYSVTDEKLQELFSAHGTVESATVIMDKYTESSRGFGFVEMSTQQEAEKAIEALNGTELEGRILTVNIARPRAERSRGGRGGYKNRW